ncbi:unnamed protein product, partial [Iphiclides podalirius]
MNPDNLALLASTLKTMQRAACDNETVSLACPKGTLISIQVAQYGKAAPKGYSCVVEGSNSREEAVEIVGEEKCLWPNAMQYSLLKTVVEACRKKPQCKFSTKSSSGSVDPCPLSRKFVEVAYKCRPYEFRSRTGCENDIIKLSCSPHSRIAIFNAQYGRTAYESNTCPQTVGVANETCTASFSAETVMQICHGKRRCQIVVNHNTFGTPCKADSKTYLKIIYGCVPLGVLMEKYESVAEKDELTTFRSESKLSDTLFDDNDAAGAKWVESNAAPPFTNPASPRGVRCLIVKRTKKSKKTSDMFTTETPNIFGDGLSDIDNDVDRDVRSE